MTEKHWKPKSDGSWRDFLTADEAEIIRDLERRRAAARKELLAIYGEHYPIQNRATQRRRAATRAV